MNNKLPSRRNIRLKSYDYSTPGFYFFTICANERKNFFWATTEIDNIDLNELPLSKTGKVVEKAILQIPNHYNNMIVDTYCIMPDHVHLLIKIHYNSDAQRTSASKATTAIASMKRYVSKEIGKSIWQKSFYDHCIRNEHDYIETYEYIRNNPKKYILKHQH